MQQILNSTPSRKTRIHLFDSLSKMAKKFFTISLMVFIFFVSFATYQIFSKKLFTQEIHIPLHATHFNIDYNEEKMLIAEVEEDIATKCCTFLLEFFIFFLSFLSVCCLVHCLVILPQDDESYLTFFMSFIMFTGILIYIGNDKLPSDLTHNQKEAFIFKKDLKTLLENKKEYPVNRNKKSILSINRYNKEVDSYNLSIQKIEDFLKKEKSYFKNYVLAQALINLEQEKISMKYIKAAADYFIETPLGKLDFRPREAIVYALELKAYGRPFSVLAKNHQENLQKNKRWIFNH